MLSGEVTPVSWITEQPLHPMGICAFLQLFTTLQYSSWVASI